MAMGDCPAVRRVHRCPVIMQVRGYGTVIRARARRRVDRPALDASGHARSLVHGPRQSYLLDPALDLLINLANLTAVVGGGMAAVIAVGYALADRGVDVWGPPVLIMLALLAANALLRGLRARRRRVSSR